MRRLLPVLKLRGKTGTRIQPSAFPLRAAAIHAYLLALAPVLLRMQRRKNKDLTNGQDMV